MNIVGIIDRRLLVNFRVDPEIAARFVPSPFRVNTSHGAAIAGICLLRLTELRPAGLPRAYGITTESAAHRFAVEWDADDGSLGHGVYIPRRDTNSRVSALLGGRVFPGVHQRAHFDVKEADDRYDLELTGPGQAHVHVSARPQRELPGGSVFDDVEDASEFFRRDTIGYSPARHPGAYDGIEMEAAHWRIDPLVVAHVRSSFFDDHSIFPPGSVEFDSALSMRRTPTRWHSRPQLIARPVRPEERAHARG